MSAKSYWQECRVTDDNQADIRALFVGMADDMHVIRAQRLCDLDTDREKKIRILASRGSRTYVLTRTKGARFSVSCREVQK